jgi:hypothetical protein
MRQMNPVLAVTLMLSFALTLSGQQEIEDPREAAPPPDRQQRGEPRFEGWLKGQAYSFGNFFQASEGEPEEDVLAGYGEVGASVKLSDRIPLRAYGSFNYIHYDDELLDSSNGFRIGGRLDGRPHAFNVYLDQQMDRPTFDVGDAFDRADVRTLNGNYSYRVTRNWQVSVEGTRQDQDFDLSPLRDNEFTSFGGAIRHRGSRIFSPEIGLNRGRRDVVDDTLSYDQQDLYLQIRSALTPALYASIRYRDRTRDYVTVATTSPYFGREDDRKQISGYADYRFARQWTLNLYGAVESNDSTIPNRDFDTSLFVLGLTFDF